MLIDCDTCRVRDLACGDCVVTVLLGGGAVHGAGRQGAAAMLGQPEPVELDAEEQTALAVLASSGLVPPLRLVSGGAESETDRGDTPRSTSRNRDGMVKRRATG